MAQKLRSEYSFSNKMTGVGKIVKKAMTAIEMIERACVMF